MQKWQEYPLALIVFAIGITQAQGQFQTYQLVGSSFLDGTSTHWEQARDIAFDSKGNVIVVGGTSASNFQTTPGAYDRTYGDGTVGTGLGNAGQTEVFIVKLDSNGRLIWSTFLGGPNYDRAYAVEIGPGDDVFVAGRAGAGFPTTAGVIQRTFAGDVGSNSEYGLQDGFVACLSADGSALKWSTYFGESGPGFIRDIAVDAQGKVYVAATSMQSTPPFASTQIGHQATVAGKSDSYYGKLSPGATELLFGTFIGGPDLGAGYSGNPSIRLGPTGDVYFTAWDPGSGVSAITPGAYQTQAAGSGDIVLVRFAQDNSIVFGTYYGGSGHEEMETHLLAVDSAGNAIIGGLTQSTDLPVTAGAVQHSIAGNAVNGFLAVVSADGKRLLAGTYIGGNARDEIEGLAVAPDGDIVFGGNTASSDLPVTSNALDAAVSAGDAFYGRLSGDLSKFRYLSYLGGTAGDSFRAIAVSDSGDVAYAGLTASSNFPLMNAYDSVMNTDVGAAQAATYARFKTIYGTSPTTFSLSRPRSKNHLGRSGVRRLNVISDFDFLGRVPR
jgi:hypothetical protein